MDKELKIEYIAVGGALALVILGCMVVNWEDAKTAKAKLESVVATVEPAVTAVSCGGSKCSDADIEAAVEIKVKELLPYGDNPYDILLLKPRNKAVSRMEETTRTLDKLEEWAESSALSRQIKKAYLDRISRDRRMLIQILDLERGPSSRIKDLADRLPAPSK